MAGGPATEGPRSRRWLWALVLGGLGALLVTLALILGAADDDGAGAAAQRAAASVPGLIDGRPRLAALAALASSRLDPSITSEMAMIAVAASQPRIQRSIETPAPRVTAAVRIASRVVTCGSDSVLRVWRPSDAAQIAAVSMPRPLVRFAIGYGSSLIAAADIRGALWVIDFTDPRRPRPVRLTAPAAGDAAILAVALDVESRTLFAIDRRGTMTRIDVSTGSLLARWSVFGATGASASSEHSLAAASFEPSGFNNDDEGLVVVRTDGEVVKLDLDRRTAKKLLGPAVIPGRALAVDEEIYSTPRLLIGSTGGFTMVGAIGQDPTVLRGPPVNGVAFDGEGEVWFTDREGVHREGQPGESLTQVPTEDDSGLVPSIDGLVAIGADGAVTLPGPLGSGMRQQDIFSSPISTFDRNGDLLIAEGSDADHTAELQLLSPGYTERGGEALLNRVVRTYKLPDSWWPLAAESLEDDNFGLGEVPGLRLADVAFDGKHLLAAGQDPNGDACLLVWDARSGRPIRHLSLSIGDVYSEEPAVLTNLVPLPGKHLVAAYSNVQQLVAIWSTETWRLLAVAPVGTAASLSASPDESTLVTVSLGEDEGMVEPAGSRLTFIDVDSGIISAEVEAPEAVEAAWAPHSGEIAVAGQDGKLRLLSAAGREEIRPPIALHAEASGLAWRPDGDLLAIATDIAGVALVDPESGRVSLPLPAELEAERSGVEWSPDGERLVAGASSYDEDAGTFTPWRPDLWWLGRARLERRMCQLAGGPIDRGAWRRLVGSESPPRPLCRRHDRVDTGGRGPAGEIARPVLAYRSGRNLFVADTEGRSAAIGHDENYEDVPFVWSGEALGWATLSQAAILADGSLDPETWVCACSGAAWHDGGLYSLRADGRALLAFRVGERRPEAIPVSGLGAGSPRLIGFAGDVAVVAALDSSSTLYAIGADRKAVPAGNASEWVFAVAGWPDADRFAFATAPIDAPLCSISPAIAVVKAHGAGVEIAYPPLPEGGAGTPHAVRSMQLDPDGMLAAAIADPGCVGLEPPAVAHPASRYELRGGRWHATGDRGGDVQRAGDGRAVLRIERPQAASTRLMLERPAGVMTVVADEVDQLAGRP